MQIDVNDTVLIVVGSELVPEEKDRPLGYELKETLDPLGHPPYQRAIVVSDRWYVENELFQVCPTIIIGGPGVNLAAAQFFQQIPIVWCENDEAFLQLIISAEKTHAAMWGVNQEATRRAMNAFSDKGYLQQFLENIWPSASL